MLVRSLNADRKFTVMPRALHSLRCVIVFGVAIAFISATAAIAAEMPNSQKGASGLDASNNPFQLIESSSSEYRALQRLVGAGLVRRYAALVQAGHPLTRYQAALVAAEAINNAKALMRDGKGSKLTSDELATLALVYDDVKGDLTLLTQRVSADGRPVAALGNESRSAENAGTSGNGSSAQPSQVRRFKPSFELHGEFRIRPVLQNSQSARAVTPAGAAVPFGTTLTRTGGPGDASITTGNSGQGSMQSRMRLVGDGHITPSADFIVRLSTEDTGGANNASLVHNDFSFVAYSAPNSPIVVYGGKLVYCCDTTWLPDGTGLIADAVPIGLAVKWTSPEPSHKASAWVSVGSIKNAETAPATLSCPSQNIGLTQNIFAAHAQYAFTSSWKVQGQLVSENSQCIAEFTDHLIANNATLTVGSLTFGHQFSKYFGMTFEGLTRFGTDPTTHASWTDNGAYYLSLRYGLFGAPYGSGVDATYIDSGKNSVIGNLDSIVNGVDSPWNFALPYANNVRTFDAGYSWAFDSNALVRLEYATAHLRMPERAANGDLILNDNRNLLILTGAFNF